RTPIESYQSGVIDDLHLIESLRQFGPIQHPDGDVLRRNRDPLLKGEEGSNVRRLGPIQQGRRKTVGPGQQLQGIALEVLCLKVDVPQFATKSVEQVSDSKFPRLVADELEAKVQRRFQAPGGVGLPTKHELGTSLRIGPEVVAQLVAKRVPSLPSD